MLFHPSFQAARAFAHRSGVRLGLFALVSLALASSTLAEEKSSPKVGERLDRRGDEIVVCGQLFHTTTPVVLWTDPGGYDAYRPEPRFGDPEKKRENYPTAWYGVRRRGLSNEELKQVRGGGWDLPLLQRVVDQFVIHYDVAGTSQRCFQVLHDSRGLSVHFMLDLDGTIYQTLDLKERAWHASHANDRSIGIEIANMGAYPPGRTAALDRWYEKDDSGRVKLRLSGSPEANGIRNLEVPLVPARNELIQGKVHGQELVQYDLTQAQYDALIRLTATLSTVFPKLKCDYPRDSSGALIQTQLVGPAYESYQGILGHYHVQRNKVDPGPAFQWDRVIDGARALMGEK